MTDQPTVVTVSTVLVRRSVSPAMFEAVTSATPLFAVAGPDLSVTFDAVLTNEEEQQVTYLLTTCDDAEMVNAQLVDTALASNDMFLALAAPTTAQAVAQVRALTRQMNAVIRLARRLPGTD